MHAGLPFHPLASIFPLMRGAEYEALVADIRAHGLLEPIVLYQEQVLDGRNRQRACLDAGIPLGTVTYEGDDPLGFVLSQNLERRQLNESQRAMAAARLAMLPVGANQHQGAQNCAPSQEQAADRMRVARRSVQSARVVQQRSQPEIVDAVDDGEMRVSAAANIAGQPRETQLARLERDRAKANGTHRQEHDWYRTPGQCTRALLRVENFDPTVWECACGDGAISKEMIAAGHTVISTDLINRGYGEVSDFLAATQLLGPDIITNPPYGRAVEFALHGLNLGVRKMALLCRLAWLEGQDRYDTLYSLGKLSRVWTFAPRQTLWRGDSNTEGDGGMTAYAWFIFEREHSGGFSGGWLTAEMLR